MRPANIGSTLRNKGFRVIDSGSQECAFDILAAGSRETLAIKMAEELRSKTVEKFAEELRKLGESLDVTPLVLCESDEIADDSVTTYKGVPSLNVETFERILKGEEIPFIYFDRGGIYVKLRGRMVRELRRERGMTLGDLAFKLGVTRRMVYEYECGRADATIEVATKLAYVLGEDVIERLNLESIRYHFSSQMRKSRRENKRLRDPLLKEFIEVLNEMEYFSRIFETTPFQIAARKSGTGSKLVVRKRDEEYGDEMTIEIAKMCESYAVLVNDNKVYIAGKDLNEKIDLPPHKPYIKDLIIKTLNA